MNSLVSSMKSVPNSTAETIEYLKKMGRLKLWSGVLGIRSLEQAASEQSRNREAESAYVRRAVWGDNGKPTEGGDVNDTVLGDMTTTHIHHAPPSSLGKMLLGAGLIATGIGIPAGAWMIASGAKDAIVKPSDPPAVSVPVEKPSERPAVNIGGYELRLGK